MCGQTGGLQLTTNTAHPIKLRTYTNEYAGTPASLQILGSGTRDVEILAPLRVNSTSSTFNNNVIIGAPKLLADTALTVMAGARIDGNLNVVGSLTVEGFIAAKPFVSLRVATGVVIGTTPSTGTILGTIGTPGPVGLTQYGFLTNVSVARGSSTATNYFIYTFTLGTPTLWD